MKVSVIIPVFNCVKYLEQAVESALIQEEVGEVIIVDDGSKDGSYELGLNLSKSDIRVHFYNHEDRLNKGSATSRNLGLNRATCDLVAFLDADDLYLPMRFKGVVEKFNDVKIDGVYGKVKNFGNNQYFKGNEIIYIEKGISPNQLFTYIVKDNKPYFGIMSLILRRKSIIKHNISFDESFRIGQDLDFIYSLASKLFLVDDGLTDIRIKRRLHLSNISIGPLHDLYNPRKALLNKWYGKIFEETFPKKVNRALIYRKLNEIFLEHNNDPKSIFRFFVKAKTLIIMLVQDKRLLYKI
jgi:glycosyltransferase involved in cell wall biosynthesis